MLQLSLATLQETEIEEAVVDLATSVVRAAPEAWIRKLVRRKKKRFSLRLAAFVWYIRTSNSPRWSTVVVDVDQGRLVSMTGGGHC